MKLTLRTLLAFLNETVSDCLDAIESVESLYISSDNVTREDFEIFNARVLARHQAIRTLAWVPRVGHADRDAYEYAARDEGCPEFSFLDGAQNCGWRHLGYS